MAKMRPNSILSERIPISSSHENIRRKIYKYCAYQERCHMEVRQRLHTYGCYYQDAEELIAELIEQDFINEERFAKAYVRGKFLHKKWGRIKISYGLKQKQISAYCIKKGLEEIEPGTYYGQLYELCESYSSKWSHLKSFECRQRSARYLIQKGYESSLVWEVVKEVISDEG